MARLFSDEALEALARSPRRQLDDAVATGTAAEVLAVATALERSFVGTVDGTRNWIAHTFGFAAQSGEPLLMPSLVDATEHFFAVYPDPIAARPDTEQRIAPLIAQLTERGDTDLATARFDAMEERWRRSQDALRDWLSVLLSRIYRQSGIETLERALRYTAERTLFDWMPTDMARAPEKRLPSWARMLQGHFSELRIEEDDEKFTLVQDPCGTCTRQIQQGRYAGPLDLAIIEEEHATTWYRGHTPIYRSHVPLWHIALAQELVGVPWPVNQCPAGLGTGPCKVLLFKDPRDPTAREHVPR
jgi:cell division inhibitor SulA